MEGGGRQVGERAGEGGGIGTYRNLPSSVVVQGAAGQLGGIVAGVGRWPVGLQGHPVPTSGVLQSAKAPASELCLWEEHRLQC